MVRAELGTQMTDLKAYMIDIGRRARDASASIAKATTGQKNSALLAIAQHIDDAREVLLEANALDMEAGQGKGLDAALLDRLELTTARIDAMLEGLRQVAALDDPIGSISEMKPRPSGIQVGRMRVPLGVIGIIYESRPNVTCEAASLCLKSGNATILRGGSEALNSNQAIARCITLGLAEAGLPADAVQVLNRPDRDAVGHLITMPEFVDVIVPRGGKGLIERISRDSRVPVIKHLDGNCHLYIESDADFDKAVRVAINAKTQRYGTCCTLESLLIDDAIADALLPALAAEFDKHSVELRGCAKTRSLVPKAIAATEEDWGEEYLAPILSVKVVSGLDEAIAHINRYSSGHTESIIT